MKGPLIKSGERAQGRLILPLIRPDKAGTGRAGARCARARSPVPRSPARTWGHGQVSTGCLGVGMGTTTPFPASTTPGAEGGPIPRGWGGSWVGAPNPGCTLGWHCETGTRLVSSGSFPRRDELPLLWRWRR